MTAKLGKATVVEVMVVLLVLVVAVVVLAGMVPETKTFVTSAGAFAIPLLIWLYSNWNKLAEAERSLLLILFDLSTPIAVYLSASWIILGGTNYLRVGGSTFGIVMSSVQVVGASLLLLAIVILLAWDLVLRIGNFSREGFQLRWPAVKPIRLPRPQTLLFVMGTTFGFGSGLVAQRETLGVALWTISFIALVMTMACIEPGHDTETHEQVSCVSSNGKELVA